MKRCTRDHTVSRAGTRWHHAISALATPIQRKWLSKPGALTAGLRQIGHLELVVLRETPALATLDEAFKLRIAPSTHLWSREVAMRIDGITSIVARSVTPLNVSRGVWQGIRQLGSRPLADILYQDPRVVRRRFEFAVCHRSDPLTGVASRAPRAFTGTTEYVNNRRQTDRLWSRRSVFVLAKQHLLVSECFLPAFWQLLHSRHSPKSTIAP